MENKSKLDPEYSDVVRNNPNKKFILYLRIHPGNANEDNLKAELVKEYGECKELTEQRLVIFIVVGKRVQGFIDKLNASGTEMYLSFIQSKDEIGYGI